MRTCQVTGQFLSSVLLEIFRLDGRDRKYKKKDVEVLVRNWRFVVDLGMEDLMKAETLSRIVDITLTVVESLQAAQQRRSRHDWRGFFLRKKDWQAELAEKLKQQVEKVVERHGVFMKLDERGSLCWASNRRTDWNRRCEKLRVGKISRGAR